MVHLRSSKSIMTMRFTADTYGQMAALSDTFIIITMMMMMIVKMVL